MIEEFDTLDEMWLAAGSQIQEHGNTVESRDGGSKEIMGYVARLKDPTAHFLFNPCRKLSPSYAGGEFLWYMKCYLQNTSSIEMIKEYAPQYERFADGKGNAYGAYGKRWENGFQLMNLYQLLKDNPNTRQSVICMWHPHDINVAYMKNQRDLPCTLNLNFLIREGKLNLVTTMRSNDFWLGMPYDVFCFTSLQILMAHALGVQIGWYQHQAMSLHIYDRNQEKVQGALATPSFVTSGFNYIPCSSDRLIFHQVESALRIEEWNRKNKCANETELEVLGLGSLLSEIVVMASTKFDETKRGTKLMRNKVMSKYIEENVYKI